MKRFAVQVVNPPWRGLQVGAGTCKNHCHYLPATYLRSRHYSTFNATYHMLSFFARPYNLVSKELCAPAILLSRLGFSCCMVPIQYCKSVYLMVRYVHRKLGTVAPPHVRGGISQPSSPVIFSSLDYLECLLNPYRFNYMYKRRRGSVKYISISQAKYCLEIPEPNPEGCQHRSHFVRFRYHTSLSIVQLYLEPVFVRMERYLLQASKIFYSSPDFQSRHLAHQVRWTQTISDRKVI